MQDPSVTESMRDIALEKIVFRHQELMAKQKEIARAQEIRRLAREFLVNNHYVSGTRIDMLNHAINNATRIYDDVEAFEIEPSGVPL